MQILDGKETARQIRQELEAETAALKAQGVEPALTVILVGDDPASQIYVRNKERGCRQVGIKSNTIRLPKETTEAELLGLIERLNNDPLVHGILVQLPLPGGIAQQKVIGRIPSHQPGETLDWPGWVPFLYSVWNYGASPPLRDSHFRPGSRGCGQEQ